MQPTDLETFLHGLFRDPAASFEEFSRFFGDFAAAFVEFPPTRDDILAGFEQGPFAFTGLSF